MNERHTLVAAWVIAVSLAQVAQAQTTPVPAPAPVPTAAPSEAPPANSALAPRALAHADTSGLRPVSRVEAVTRALENNPTLRLAELDVKSAQADVRGEQGRYPFYLSA